MKTLHHTTYLALALASTFLHFSPTSLIAKTTVVFDIHGVLLKEDVASLVQKKIEALLAQNRSMADNQTFKDLCKLMEVYRPLGTPTADYDSALGVPYEVYVLFAGIRTPEEVRTAILEMLSEAIIKPRTKLIYTALIETIFDNATRLGALTVIESGAALLDTCLSNEDMEIYIYTNAPQEWVSQYKTLFPTLFSRIDDSRIIASGTTGLVKPDPAVFELLCQRASCLPTELILIDDSKKNCKAASAFGATGIQFLAPKLP